MTNGLTLCGIAALCILATLAACSGGGSSASAPATSSTSAIAPPPVSNATIGSSGATLDGAYGAQLIIPAQALSADTNIAIARDSTGAPALPSSGVDTAGAIYAFTPHGTTFAQPVRVRIPFNAEQLPTDALPKLYKAETGGAFAEIPSTVDGATLLADISGFSWITPGYASTKPRVVYAMTSTGVSSFKITRTSGVLSAATSTALTGEVPLSVTVHPSRRFAFVTNGGSASANGVAPNSISSYSLNPATGTISGPTGTLLATTTTPTKPISAVPISAVVHPSGKFVYVVNHERTGSSVNTDISVFTINGTSGALSGPSSTADSGGAPPTAIAFNPSGSLALVTYIYSTSTPVGNTYKETVKAYTVDATTGLLSGPVSSAAAGSNPWSVVVEPLGKFAYVASLSTNEVRVYSINSTNGALTNTGGINVVNKPASLAVDTQGRFLYVGKQDPLSNVNILSFAIDSGTGALSAAGSLLTSGAGSTGPIAVAADPQGEFVYAINNNKLSAFKLNPASGSSGLAAAGTAVNVAVPYPGSAGVGVPLAFAVSGTSPVWQNGCTLGCFQTGGGGSGGGSGGSSSSATHFLTALYGVWGGAIVSSPAGIDYSSNELFKNAFRAEFTSGSTVTLCGTQPSQPVQGYDVQWSGTGGCGGTGTCTSVLMDKDQYCNLCMTPVSARINGVPASCP